jgi:hypothetical protein
MSCRTAVDPMVGTDVDWKIKEDPFYGISKNANSSEILNMMGIEIIC